MVIYLDLCCVKRAFDDQSQPRIRLETEALLSILSAESDAVRFIRSTALFLENSVNPIVERASRTEQWLRIGVRWRAPDVIQLRRRVGELMQMGFKNFDALHVASAEEAGSDFFVSCDDRLLKTADRNRDRVHVRVVGLVECANEVIK